MDNERFDHLVRRFGRRAGLRGVFAGLLAVLVPAVGAAEPGGAGNTGKHHRGGEADGNRGRGRRGEGNGAAGGGDGGSGGGPDAVRCVANGQRCGKGSGKRGKKDVPCAKCCSKYGTPQSQGPRRCSCKPNGAACANPSQCCGGQCTGAQCGPCDPGLTLCQPDGCIDPQISAAHCGSCGVACADGQTCRGGACACTAASCPGCCDGTTCRPGTTTTFCGKNGGGCVACVVAGAACEDGNCVCPSGVICSASGCCGSVGDICDQDDRCCTPEPDATICVGKCGLVQNNCGQPVNCTPRCSGCCDGGTCRAGTSDANCGTNGAGCQTCAGTNTCGGGGTPGVCGCTPDCAGKACGANDGCGGACQTGSCATCQVCGAGVCGPAPNGAACGTQAGGGTLRCCNDACPDPTCRPAGTPCEPGETPLLCRLACCSNNQNNFTNRCQGNVPDLGARCGSDADCRPEFNAICLCGRCRVTAGNPAYEDRCGTCASGACLPATTTCS